MKTFSVAVAVAVVLAFACLQESYAVPAAEVQELREMMNNGTLAAALEEMSEEAELKELQDMMSNGELSAALEEPSNNRRKRDIWSRLKRRGKRLFKDIGNGIRKLGKHCRPCCNCNCGFSGCGTCCRF